jgi:hypothetical protein
MMAPRQCQIHYIALYTLLFILTLLEKEKEAFALSLFFSLSLSIVRALFLLCTLNFLHIYREGTLQFVLLYIVTLRE